MFFLRALAQNIRHAPGLRSLEPLWWLVRGPYVSFLRLIGGRRGIQVHVGGRPIRLLADLVNLSWESIEPRTYEAFWSEVGPEDYVIDIGAHYGTYSILAAGRGASVLAYEPCEESRYCLRKNLQFNGVTERVEIREVCCGSRDGEADFYVLPRQAEGRNSLIATDGFEKTTTRVVSLDSDVASLGLIPTVVKIDVEGAELDVLAGAENTLRTLRPRLFLSLHPKMLGRQGFHVDDVLKWLENRNYSAEILERDHEIRLFARSN